ncbi:hypothetical protein GCM10009677_55000 [Sphaerisporangium rubeum]
MEFEQGVDPAGDGGEVGEVDIHDLDLDRVGQGHGQFLPKDARQQAGVALEDPVQCLVRSSGHDAKLSHGHCECAANS